MTQIQSLHLCKLQLNPEAVFHINQMLNLVTHLNMLNGGAKWKKRIKKMKTSKPNVSYGFHFILIFTHASSFLIFMCCCTLTMHYFLNIPNVREQHKIHEYASWAVGANETNGIPKTGMAKVATPREKKWGLTEWNVFSYCTSFLQAGALKGEWHNLNIYLLYNKPLQ